MAVQELCFAVWLPEAQDKREQAAAEQKVLPVHEPEGRHAWRGMRHKKRPLMRQHQRQPKEFVLNFAKLLYHTACGDVNQAQTRAEEVNTITSAGRVFSKEVNMATYKEKIAQNILSKLNALTKV